MEPRPRRQKFLTLDGEGGSRISRASPAGRARRASSSPLPPLTLLPASEASRGEPRSALTFYVVCREAEGEGKLGAGEPAPGLAGLERGRQKRGAGAAGIHAGAMGRAALRGLSRLCALWAALLALFPCGAQGNWM